MLLLLAALPPAAACADAWGLEALLLSGHASDRSLRLGERYSRKLSSDGRFVLTPGLELYYDRMPQRAPLGIDVLRFTLGGYLDSMNQKSGYVAILPRWEFPLTGKIDMSFGLGPTLIFRESWKEIPGYRDDGFYNESDSFLPGYQYKPILGGDLDFRYRLAPDLEAVWSIVPAVPYVISQSLGLRWSF